MMMMIQNVTEKKKKDKKLKKMKQLKQKKKSQKKRKAREKSSSSSSSDSSSSDSESEPEKKSKKKKKRSTEKKDRAKFTSESTQEELFDVNILNNIKTERITDDEKTKQLEFSPRRQKPREIINVKELQNDFVGNSIQIKKEAELEEQRHIEEEYLEEGLVEKREEVSQETQREAAEAAEVAEVEPVVEQKETAGQEAPQEFKVSLTASRSPWFLRANMGRNEIATAVRLRSGHIPMNKFGYMMGKTITPNCEECGITEDVFHIIMECARNDVLRRDLFNDDHVFWQVGGCNAMLSQPQSDDARKLFDLYMAAVRLRL